MICICLELFELFDTCFPLSSVRKAGISWRGIIGIIGIVARITESADRRTKNIEIYNENNINIIIFRIIFLKKRTSIKQAQSTGEKVTRSDMSTWVKNMPWFELKCRSPHLPPGETSKASRTSLFLGELSDIFLRKKKSKSDRKTCFFFEVIFCFQNEFPRRLWLSSTVAPWLRRVSVGVVSCHTRCFRCVVCCRKLGNLWKLFKFTTSKDWNIR